MLDCDHDYSMHIIVIGAPQTLTISWTLVITSIIFINSIFKFEGALSLLYDSN